MLLILKTQSSRLGITKLLKEEKIKRKKLKIEEKRVAEGEQRQPSGEVWCWDECYEEYDIVVAIVFIYLFQILKNWWLHNRNLRRRGTVTLIWCGSYLRTQKSLKVNISYVFG